MPRLELRVDPDTLTLDDLCALEEGKATGLRDLLARLMVDEAGEPVPFEAARKLAGKLTLSELKEQGEALSKALKASAVPPKRAAG